MHTVLRVTAALSVALAVALEMLAPVSQADRARVRIVTGLTRLPLHFIENRGQLDPRVAYHVDGRDQRLYFSPEGVTFLLRAGARSPAMRPAALGRDDTEPRWVVKLGFVDANPLVTPVGRELLPGVVSWFTGAPAQWKTALRTYGALTYPDLWPGIDLTYRGTADRLKYTFVVRPGARPDRIRLAYDGARVTLDEAGRLQVSTPVGDFADDAPSAWQDVNGRRIAVAASYALAAGTATYGFRLGPYDPTRPLVLDPAVFVYSGFLGGGGGDRGTAIAVDGAGNAYVTGTTSSSENTFPVRGGPDLTYGGGSQDVFVAKVRADGSGLVYAGYIGGTKTEASAGIAVDADGAAYVAGVTTSSPADGFPVKGGPGLTYNGGGDAFVAKVSPDGTTLAYCGYIGGGGPDQAGGAPNDALGGAIAVDRAGSAYVAGRTDAGSSEPDTFPAKVGPALTRRARTNAFVAKVAADGSQLDYAGFIGGDFYPTIAYAIAVDDGGSAYVTGRTQSFEADNFPLAVGPDLTFNNDTSNLNLGDAFVAKVRADGAALDYCGYVGGAGSDVPYGIAVDAARAAYVTGQTDDGVGFPAIVGPDTSFNGEMDAFVAKVAADGTRLEYAGYIGGAPQLRDNEAGFGIAVDGAGHAYVTGVTLSSETDGFPVLGGPDLTYNGGPPTNFNGPDGFVARVRADGAGLDHCGYIGGGGIDAAHGVAVDGTGSAYVIGDTSSGAATFPLLAGPSLTPSANGDVFVTKVMYGDSLATTSTMAPGTPSPSTTSTTVRAPEVCGNCTDDNDDGLVDFEDPLCCRADALTVRALGMKPRAGGSRLALSAALPGGRGIAEPRQDVFLQLGVEGGAPIACATIPAARLQRKGKVAKFKDRRHTERSALGLDALVLRGVGGKRLSLTAKARRAAFAPPPPARLQVTVAFRDPAAGDTGHRCAIAVKTLRGTRKGAVRFP